ncbi:hypothetical protein [Streptomyces sp. KL116D]|uniref:hypothetical protein n=1 Tax=Streptomyces sp. KL116D TaxID=3045152 RepID=UPI0035566B4D
MGTLRRGEGGLARFHRSAAEAFVAGAAVTWESGLPRRRRPLDRPARVRLPGGSATGWTPHESTAAHPAARGGTGTADHPLLDAVIDLTDDAEHGALAATGRLSVERHPWLAAHAVHGAVLVPAAVPLELACGRPTAPAATSSTNSPWRRRWCCPGRASARSAC